MGWFFDDKDDKDREIDKVAEKIVKEGNLKAMTDAVAKGKLSRHEANEAVLRAETGRYKSSK